MTRTREILAMLMIGDGVVGALVPRRHVQRWQRGPRAWQQLMGVFATRPALTRLLAIVEVIGAWYAVQLPGGNSDRRER
ncbi:hypothetical protein BH20ACT9_BH20ACT9_12970 [soil metagenome]